MPQTISIPGRRISHNEVFYTDWVPRGGDCILLHVEILFDGATGDNLVFSLETRGEDGTTVTTIDPFEPSGGLELDAVGVGTCLYLADATDVLGNGAQEQVRVRVECTGGSEGDYYVVRIFPLIFFDSARPY